VLEALLDGSLIGCTYVFEPKRHGHVAVSTKGHDEGCLDLVLLSQKDLMVTTVSI
jgi:hypothetical protein